MANRHDLLIRLDSEFSDKGFRSAEQSAKVLERELDKQEAAERRLASLQMAAHREDQQRRAAQLMGMEQVGRGFTAVGLLAAAGLGVASKAAVDWETAWAGVTKTVSGTPEQMAALERELRNLATTLPATHEEIAGVAEAAGQLGVKRQDIAAFTKTMIDLGVSTNLSADEAATGIAQISNVMGTMSREGSAGVSRFGATLVALGNDGASTERDILQMAARVAGAGKMVGASESDVLALSNAMSSLGIEAELGGGAMSRTIIKINSAVKEGGEGLDKFAKVSGVSAQVFAEKWRSDPIAAVDLFVKGLARVNASGGDAAGTLKDVGLAGTQNAQVLLRMTGAGDLLTRSLELGNQAWEQNSALVNEANKRYETTESRLKIARNELNNAAIDIGANVLPALAGGADRVGFLAESFHALPEPVKEAVTVLGGIVMTVGLLGGAALILIPKLVAMNATLAASGPAGARAASGLSAAGRAIMGPWGVALAAATLALGIFAEKQYEAKQRTDELQATLDAQTGAFTENTRAKIVNSLEEDGVLKSAQSLGIALDDVTNAILGQSEARDRLNGQLAVADQFSSTDPEAIEQQGNAIQKVRDAIGGQNEALARAQEQWQRQRDAMGSTAEATDGLAGSQQAGAAATSGAAAAAGEFAAAQDGAASSTEDARKELDALIKSVEGYGDTVNSALDAQSSYEEAIDAANAAIEKNGKTANKARTAINLHTEAGRSNDKALRSVATSALEAATANFQNGRSVKNVTADVMKARDEFVTMATKMGLNKEAANRLADQLGLTRGNVQQLNTEIGKTPASKTVTMKAETEQALREVKAFQAAINALRGKSVEVRYVRTGVNPGGGRSTAGGSTFDSAEGNLFSFSGGGYAPIGIQQPQIRLAAGDGLRWSEQGAGAWESFISGNPAKRDRSLAIWEDTGRRLGAFEAMRSQPAVMVEGAKSIDRSLTVTAYGHSAADVAREIRRSEAKRAALYPEFGG